MQIPNSKILFTWHIDHLKVPRNVPHGEIITLLR